MHDRSAFWNPFADQFQEKAATARAVHQSNSHCGAVTRQAIVCRDYAGVEQIQVDPHWNKLDCFVAAVSVDCAELRGWAKNGARWDTSWVQVW